jgi:hypothetical protein
MNKTTIATSIISIALAIISLLPGKAFAADLDERTAENENAEVEITDEVQEEYDRCVSRFKEEECPSLERIAQILEDRSRRVRRSCGYACALYRYSRITGRPYYR